MATALELGEQFFKDEKYRSKLLVAHGFIKEGSQGKYSYDEKADQYLPQGDSQVEESDADEENVEILKDTYGRTGFPQPVKSYRLSWEIFDLSLEEPYFWVLDILKENFPNIDKVEDSFAAAENSAFFGVTQQRLGAQQDKVSQLLAQMGKMIKELFQMVRELRIIDERLHYYGDVEVELQKPLAQRSKVAEITLKGFFVDLVQGGGKSPASVYGMARELEFITLPDLFFDAPPLKSREELDEHVNSLKANFNENVIRVLSRHLNQYMIWRQSTSKEHASRKIFMLKYLEQHYEIIRMYITWVKPYLRHTTKLSMKDKSLSSADLVSAFEGSMLDVEVLASREIKDGGYSCILATFYYRTRPELKVVQEGYQRGPVHIGRFEVNLRVYGWTKSKIEMYKKLKVKETMVLLESVADSVATAMGSLGDDLQKYLDEAKGGKKTEESGEKKDERSFAEKYFGDFYTPRKGQAKKGKSARELARKEEEAKENAEGASLHGKAIAWSIFHTFKKAHRMIAW